MKKVMICVDLTNYCVDLFKARLKNWNWNSVEEIHFVHSHQLQVYADAFYLNTFPTKEQYSDIRNSVNSILEDLATEIFKDQQELKKKINLVYKCLIETSPKDALVEYATEKKIDNMFIGTRGHHGLAGLFTSSLAQYMVGHCPCDLVILRPASK